MRWSKAKAGVSALQSDWLDEEWDMVREEVIEVLREMGVVKDNIKLTRELLFSADKMQELLERLVDRMYSRWMDQEIRWHAREGVLV